jgi:stearoyl-CoA desaturase (delta-9 desaturase)
VNLGANIDMSDVLDDPIVRFQRKHYYKLIGIFWCLIPTIIPHILWGESIKNSFLICVLFRYIYSLHSTWLVNSAAHLWGNKPYNYNIEPRENEGVIFASFGEGYHNYHHTFPWDYSTSEFGWKYNFNFTTLLIDFFAFIGLAYDRKTVSKDMIKNKMARTGDGSAYSRNRLLHWILGIASGTWILWFTFLLRFLLT